MGGLSTARKVSQYLLPDARKAAKAAEAATKPVTEAGTLTQLLDAPATREDLAATITPGIHAYHASPHSFEKFEFSPQTEGTGEGAAAYGHGLYFAENPAVSGKGGIYDKQFSTDTKPANIYEVNIKAKPEEFLDWYKPVREQRTIFDRLLDHFGGRDALLRKREELEQAAKDYTSTLGVDDMVAAQNRFDTLSRDPAAKLGSMLYDLEKPPSAWYDPGEKITGESLYHKLGRGSRRSAEILSEVGVPGIKYADFGSRGALSDSAHSMAKNYGSRERALEVAQERLKTASVIDGSDKYWQRMVDELGTPTTSNYVVFDDKLIEIVKKYGIAGALGAGLISQEEADQLRAQQGQGGL